ncbi:acyltransferase family protein [Spirosoma radiotolerans]|uniref:Acyltransferase n=1 Tax=Spirosoma radiotolerans TaxID=1379870 RepID=A0A0E3ZZL4_9BACT|nr:acyltransferase [Spirosoma radiotolerans]AKD57433.1 acyltransferase [Spirosoma radiotolerans]
MGELKSATLSTKPHFAILDGLRGVAALAIVIFHFMEWVYPDPSRNFIAHGFLAVDFFFCLSGFVMGYAYDDRIRRLGLAAFFRLRLIRLHPLVILGSVLGLLGFLFDPFAAHPDLSDRANLLLTFVCSLCLIPLPIMKERAFNLFSFNAPAWSLFWEYVANIIYALVLYRISRRYLSVFIVLAATVLCLVSYRAGNLLGGWSGPTFWDGGARIAYSFLAGLFIYRANWILKNGLGFVGVAGLLILAFLMPFTQWNGLTEPIIVLLYFPALLVAGAGATLSPGLEKLCVFLGKLSYPIYMTHYGAMWIFGSYLATYKPDTLHLSLIVVTGVVFLAGFAYLVQVFYDEPIRRYLAGRR